MLKDILLAVCAFGIMIGLVVPVWYLFHPRERPAASLRWKLVLIEVLFALTSVMALLFGLDASLDAKVPVEIRMGGPFAAFLGSVLLILSFSKQTDAKHDAASQQVIESLSKELPELLVGAIGQQVQQTAADRLVESMAMKLPELLVESTKDKIISGLAKIIESRVTSALAQAIAEAQTNSGWVPYSKLKESLAGFEQINGKEEEYFVRNLLGAGYSPSEEVRVENAKIDTAFIYLKDSPRESATVVKFQRVRGELTSEARQQGAARIRFRSFSSYGTRGVRSVIFVSDKKVPDNPFKIRITDCDPRATSDSEEGDPRITIKTPLFDYFIMTEYKEFPDHEDYLLVDPSRFCKEQTATPLRFAVASTHKLIDHPQAWRMRRPEAVVGQVFPLVFHRLESQPRNGWGQLLAELLPWAQWMDSTIGDKSVRDKLLGDKLLRQDTSKMAADIRNSVIGSVAEALPKSAPQDLATALQLIGPQMTYSLELDAVPETLLVLFRWAGGSPE